jgi:large subunit ribosomal protein L17
MRHRVKGKKLGRDSGHRKALFKNLINALILREEIKTTESKAKAIRGLVDKLITQGKAGTLHARRLIAAFLANKQAVNKLVDEVAPRFGSRPGGFTRIIRLGRRRGDDAMMVKLELVEKKEEEKPKKKKVSKKVQETKKTKKRVKEKGKS